MDEQRASWTAEIMAMYRAVESLKPEGERVCHDSLAAGFVSPPYRLLFKSRRLTEALLWMTVERPWPGDYGTIVLRTRYIDDYLKACIEGGLRQLVILGAGYDSRPYRIHGIEDGLRVFEVDHPATQRAKVAAVGQILGRVPAYVTHVPVDFNVDSLEKRLSAAGYDSALRTLFIWEGVTMYLDRAAVEATLRFIAGNSGPGTSVIFDYLLISDHYDPEQQRMMRKNEEALLRRGEPWTFGLRDDEVEPFLSEFGFSDVVAVGGIELSHRYFTGANRGRKTYAFLPIVHATVSAGSAQTTGSRGG